MSRRTGNTIMEECLAIMRTTCHLQLARPGNGGNNQEHMPTPPIFLMFKSR
jgi:hypothetical protein